MAAAVWMFLFPQLLQGHRPEEVPCSQTEAEQWAVYGWGPKGVLS
jgi:hypothetical protein